MSVKIANSLGDIKCTWCNQPLIVSAKTSYKECDNCGWPIDVKNKPKISVKYHEYIANLYENNPTKLAFIIWFLGYVTGMMINYLVMR